MTYYKLIHSGEIVDVLCGDNAIWMTENPRSLTLYVGAQEQARGVLSSDGQTTYHIAGTPPFAEYPQFADVALEEISPDEYQALREELDAGRQPVEPAQEPPEPAEQPGEAPAPKTRMAQLESLVADLQAQNDMLAECLMEMSEIVYG